MTVQTVKLAGEQYVLLKKKDYNRLKAQSAPKGRRRLTAQDRGDIAEAKRRRNEPATPYSKLRDELGLK